MTNMLELPIQPPIYPNTAALPTGAIAGTTAIVLSSPPTIYIFDGSSWVLVTTGGSTAVTSVSSAGFGLTASPITGDVVLTLAQSILTSASPTFTGLKISSAASIGTVTANASAILTLVSTTLGFLPPVMTTVQKNAIVSPAVGLMVFDSNVVDIEFWNGSSWIGTTVSGVVSIAGTANQIVASASTGAIVLSLSTTIITPGSLSTTTTLGVGTSSIVSGINLQVGNSSTASTSIIRMATNSGTNNNPIMSWFGSGITDQIFALDTSQTSGNLIWAVNPASYAIIDIRIATKITFHGNSGGLNIGFSSTVAPPTSGLIVTGQTAIGTSTADSSALLTLSSSTQGFLPPRGTTTQKNAIATPTEGLTFYDTTLHDYQFYNGSVWVGDSLSGVTSITGTANQVIASASTGAVTLSLPQSIATSSTVQFGIISAGATADASAILTLSSTTKGLLPPGGTTTQKNAILSPATGLVFYDTTIGDLQFYNGSGWIGTTASGVTSVTGTAAQITASPTSGAVVLSLPSAIVTPGSLAVNGAATASTQLTVTGAVNFLGASSTVQCLLFNGSVSTANTNCYGINFQPTLNISANNQNEYGIYSNVTFNKSSTGTLSTIFSHFIDAGASNTTPTTAIGLFVAVPTIGGTTNTAIACGNLNVGFTASTVILANSAGISGQVGIGIVPASDRMLAVGGDRTSTSNNYGIVLAPRLGSTSGTVSTCVGLDIYNDFTNNAGVVTIAYGLFVDTGGGGSGTVTYGYGGFFSNPNFGSSAKVALYSANASIGFANVTPPSAGLMVSGDSYFGASSAIASGGKIQSTRTGYNIVASDGTATVGLYTNSGSASGNQIMLIGYSNHTLGFATNNNNAQMILTPSGATAFGTTSPNSTIFHTINSSTTFTYGSLFGGNLLALGGSQDAIGLIVNPGMFGPASSTPVSCKGIYISPVFTAGAVGTVNFIGIHIDGTSMTGSGTAPTNGYAIHATMTFIGTNKYGINLEGTGTITSGNAIYGIRNAADLGCTSGSQGTAFHMYMNPAHSSNTATINNAYGLYIDSGTTAGTISTGITAQLLMPAYGSSKIGLAVGGSCQVGNGINNLIALEINPSMGCSSGTLTDSEYVYIYPNYSSNAGTITTAYGMLIGNGATAGTIGTGYGLYVFTPAFGTTKITASFQGPIQISSNSTGSGTALLSTNCPAVTNSAPYTWIKFIASDGSTIYVPAWK